MANAPSISKRWLWAYEGAATAGTPAITGASDTTYKFGNYSKDVKKWNFDTIENKVGEYRAYNTRNPSTGDDGTVLTPFTHTYHPTSGQHLVWQMGKCTDASPDTFGAADYNKEQYSLTIRGEKYNSGNTSADNFIQYCGCYSVKLYGVIQAGMPYTVEQTFEYMNVDYMDDGNAYPILTTAPSNPDTSATPYVGLPKITYDYGGSAYTIPNVIKFDYTSEAIYSQSYDTSAETTQTIHKEAFKPTIFTFQVVSEVNTMFNDLMSQSGTKEIRVEIFKADATEYIILDLTNCRLRKLSSEGEGFDGWYLETYAGMAEALSGSFTGQGTFSTHYKGETT